MQDDLEQRVRTLLAAAGIAPPREDVAHLSASFAAARPAADELYRDVISRFDPVFIPPIAESGGVHAETTDRPRDTPDRQDERARRSAPSAARLESPIDTIEDAARALRTGRTTSFELTTRCLARADRLDAQLGTFIARFDASALAAAKAIDADFAGGIDRGPLQGIPLGIKDIIAAREGPTTACSKILLGHPDWGSGQDAPVVARLRAQGAVILGKSTTMEFAMGPPDPEGPFPIHRNPWDLTRWPGGSSSGTGSGVAAGLMLGGLGSDTGGSIRIPSALCGLSGLKPTYGLVPKSRVVPLAHSLDTVGPIARSARDCALLLQSIAGGAPDDPTSSTHPVPDYAAALTGDLSGLTIGVERAHHVAVPGFDAACRARFEAAVVDLERAGARIVEVRFDGYPDVLAAAMLTSAAESFAYHRNDLARRFEDYGRGARRAIGLGALYGAADYLQAQRARAFGLATWRRLRAQCDAIVTPTIGLPAPRIDEDFWAMMTWTYTPVWNFLGTPAMSVPMGPIAGGMPSGLQIIGGHFEDATVLRVADAYQRVTQWHRRSPTLE